MVRPPLFWDKQNELQHVEAISGKGAVTINVQRRLWLWLINLLFFFSNNWEKETGKKPLMLYIVWFKASSGCKTIFFQIFTSCLSPFSLTFKKVFHHFSLREGFYEFWTHSTNILATELKFLFSLTCIHKFFCCLSNLLYFFKDCFCTWVEGNRFDVGFVIFSIPLIDQLPGWLWCNWANVQASGCQGY